MKIKNTYTIDPTILALDLAIQMDKARRILNDYKNDKTMTQFGKGCLSTTRQMIKWQVWSNPTFKTLIVKECRRVRVVEQKTNN